MFQSYDSFQSTNPQIALLLGLLLQDARGDDVGKDVPRSVAKDGLQAAIQHNPVHARAALLLKFFNPLSPFIVLTHTLPFFLAFVVAVGQILKWPIVAKAQKSENPITTFGAMGHCL